MSALSSIQQVLKRSAQYLNDMIEEVEQIPVYEKEFEDAESLSEGSYVKVEINVPQDKAYDNKFLREIFTEESKKLRPSPNNLAYNAVIVKARFPTINDEVKVIGEFRHQSHYLIPC